MKNLSIFFFPLLAHGHMIPTLDLAKLFSSKGVKSTIITTPRNVRHFEKAIDRAVQLGQEISIKVIPFSAKENGLPENCECADEVPFEDDMMPKFFCAMSKLQPELERILDEFRPDCLVADMFFPWATDSAAKFGIPRLVFHGMSFFSLCAIHCLTIHKPHGNVVSETEPFVIPTLPHEVKMMKMQLADHHKEESDTEFSRLIERVKESELVSYGVIVNSFYELEPDYADYFRRVLKRRAWHVGPVSLCNREIQDKANRGKESSIDKHECLKWLNLKKPKSVIYISFGSVAEFSKSQMIEIAAGLEDSGHSFIWVVRQEKNDELLPAGFENRVKERGLIIWGWAPQVLILEHESIGGFLTHCGWNSIQEAICAGVPMVTWPVSAEQFFNEVMVKDILKIGVEGGSKRWTFRTPVEEVKREMIAGAVKRVMKGEIAEGMRERMIALKKKAMMAVEEGGSSYTDLDDLLHQLSDK
ncbi:scopoletin glucosyltransferase-like [Impatiens glandulifera]|uniref:scopoletin glucosyltransferase-like n=1 Tax=Impatiens glandulifera TaxID=253017 RepID=UPI001FB09B78|nr:scopoletin glucosyltransferase-like [Impatiens glandulifera]